MLLVKLIKILNKTFEKESLKSQCKGFDWAIVIKVKKKRIIVKSIVRIDKRCGEEYSDR